MSTERKKRQEGELFREIGNTISNLSGKGAEDRAKALKEKQEAREAKAEKKREVRGVDSWDYVQKQSDKRKIRQDYKNPTDGDYKKGGIVKSSVSKRADGCAKRGKTKGRMV